MPDFFVQASSRSGSAPARHNGLRLAIRTTVKMTLLLLQYVTSIDARFDGSQELVTSTAYHATFGDWPTPAQKPDVVTLLMETSGIVGAQPLSSIVESIHDSQTSFNARICGLTAHRSGGACLVAVGTNNPTLPLRWPQV
jgi:hypothetical protein